MIDQLVHELATIAAGILGILRPTGVDQVVIEGDMGDDPREWLLARPSD